MTKREEGRYEITHVPAAIRNRDRVIGHGPAVQRRYERVTFEKSLISVHGKPPATFLCPGHALLDAVIEVVLERHRTELKRGPGFATPSGYGNRGYTQVVAGGPPPEPIEPVRTVVGAIQFSIAFALLSAASE